MRSGEEDGHRGHDGEEREDKEADAVHDHGGELPVRNELVLVLPLLQLRRDETELPDDGLQVPLSLGRERERERDTHTNSGSILTVKTRQGLRF